MHTCIGAPHSFPLPQLTFEVRQVRKGVPEADDRIKPIPWLLQVLLQCEPVGLLNDCSTWKWMRAGTPNSLPCLRDPTPASPSPSQAPGQQPDRQELWLVFAEQLSLAGLPAARPPG